MATLCKAARGVGGACEASAARERGGRGGGAVWRSRTFVSTGNPRRHFKFHCQRYPFAVGKFKVRPAKRTPVALCRIPRDIAGFTGSKALWG